MSDKKTNTIILLGSSFSESLAAQVVVYRSLGLNKEIAILCMAELARRRGLGEDFKYEEYIESEVAKIPRMQGIENKASIMNLFSSLKR